MNPSSNPGDQHKDRGVKLYISKSPSPTLSPKKVEEIIFPAVEEEPDKDFDYFVSKNTQ